MHGSRNIKFPCVNLQRCNQTCVSEVKRLGGSYARKMCFFTALSAGFHLDPIQLTIRMYTQFRLPLYFPKRNFCFDLGASVVLYFFLSTSKHIFACVSSFRSKIILGGLVVWNTWEIQRNYNFLGR